MIAATKQHTGKTSVSMAVLSGLMQYFGQEKIGYLKPIGQRYTMSHGIPVDCDVDMARSYFNMDRFSCHEMSPIVIHEYMTREFLERDDDHHLTHQMIDHIQSSYRSISQKSEFVVVEGSGHVGVGSLLGISNAKIAQQLGLDMVLVVNAGIGRMFDELMLNLQMCAANHVHVRGIIINRIRDDKQQDIRKYMEKALQKNHLPILGMIPDKEMLDSPSIMDLERLFHTELLSGKNNHMRRFRRYELVTTSLRRLLEKIHVDDHAETCFLAHRTRDDIVLGLLSHTTSHLKKFHAGLIMTGKRNPNNNINKDVLDYIVKSNMPVLDVDYTTSESIRMINGYTAKMCPNDTERVSSVISHYLPFIDMRKIMDRE